MAQWLVREKPGRYAELLWLLPAGGPEAFAPDEEWISDICAHAVRLFEQHGAEPDAGVHYEEFVLFAARSIGPGVRDTRRRRSDSDRPRA